MKKIIPWAAMAFFLLAEAAPKVPAADSDVLERLPGRPRDPANAHVSDADARALVEWILTQK